MAVKRAKLVEISCVYAGDEYYGLELIHQCIHDREGTWREYTDNELERLHKAISLENQINYAKRRLNNATNTWLALIIDQTSDDALIEQLISNFDAHEKQEQEAEQKRAQKAEKLRKSINEKKKLRDMKKLEELQKMYGKQDI